MSVIQTNEALQAYIKEKCRLVLDPDGTKSDFDIEIALKRLVITQHLEWEKFCDDVIQFNFDTDETVSLDTLGGPRAAALVELHQKIGLFVGQIVSDVKKDGKTSQTDRSSTQRLIRDYFLPHLVQMHNNNRAELDRINIKLISDQQNTELLEYQAALASNAAYLDSLVAFPFALERMMTVMSQNLGHNYTPRQNAQVLASLLDTIQKSQEGSSWKAWTAKNLLKAVKVASKVIMPDLPVDRITLEAISDLLPYVNKIIDNDRELEQQKKMMFPDGDPKKSSARKYFFESMGIRFDSLGKICYDTLIKPAEDALQAASTFMSTETVTEEGVDYLNVLSALDQIGDMLHGLPEELVPKFLKPYSDYYQGYHQAAKYGVRQAAAAVDYVAKGAGQVLGTIGSVAYDYTPDSVKTVAGAAADKAVDVAAQVVTSAGPAVSKAASTAEYLLPSMTVNRWTGFLVNKQTLINIRDRVVIAAAAFVPASIKERMRPQTPETVFWNTIRPVGAIEPQLAEAYLIFHELAAASGSQSLEEDFFQAYMQKNGISQANYGDYVALKRKLVPVTLSRPLNELRTMFEAAEDQGKRFDGMLYLVHRLNNLQRQAGEAEEITSILDELTEALHHQSADQQLVDFIEIYVRSSLEKSLAAYEKKQFCPLLEKILDINSENVQLRQIYSKLQAGYILSDTELTLLKEFPKVPPANITFPIVQNVEDITKEVVPVLSSVKIEQAFTPKEKARQQVQVMLDKAAPICRHISEGLEKQLEACQSLRALCPNDPLKSLCDSKIAYLQALQQCNTRVLEEMKPGGKLAEQIRKITSGEVATDLLNMTSAKNMAKQLMFGAWSVPKAAMDGAGPAERVLAYALNSNEYLQGIIQAKHAFDKRFDTTPPPPELMPALGGPVLLKAERVADKAAETLVGWGRDYVVQPLATYYIAGTALSLAFPQALIAEIAVGILTRESVQKQLGAVLQPVTDFMQPIIAPVTDFMGKQQQMLKESVTDYICPMLNIEVQRILEQKAFAYVSSDPAVRSKMKEGERDSFSGFYLQYRAIQEANPILNKEDCIKYLFKGFLDGKEPVVQNNTIQEFSSEFAKLDDMLRRNDAAAKDSKETSELERELQFLMAKIDFNAPNETALVTMTIYNRLMLMQFEASKQVSKDHASKLQKKALGVLETVLTSLERADAGINTTDPADARTATRAEALLPATQRAAEIKLSELRTKLDVVSNLVDRNIRDRDDRLKADSDKKEPKQLGRTVLAAEVAKSTKTNLLYKMGRAIFSTHKAVSVWVAIGIVIASKGILPAILGAIGVAGATAANIVTGGLWLAAAILATRVIYTVVNEVIDRRDEFHGKSTGVNILTGLKCLGIGMVKSVMADVLYKRVSDIFSKFAEPAIEGAKTVRHLARAHPTRDIIDTEKVSLSVLQEQLQELQCLVKAQIKDKEIVEYAITKPDSSKFGTYKAYRAQLQTYKAIDTRAGQIEEKSKEVSATLEATQALLQKNSSNDVRWEHGVTQELKDYKEAFARLKEVMEEVNLVKKVGDKMRPEMRDYEKPVQLVSSDKKSPGLEHQNCQESRLGEDICSDAEEDLGQSTQDYKDALTHIKPVPPPSENDKIPQFKNCLTFMKPPRSSSGDDIEGNGDVVKPHLHE